MRSNDATGCALSAMTRPLHWWSTARWCSRSRRSDCHAASTPRRFPSTRYAQRWPTLGMAGVRVLRELMSPRRAIRNLEGALGARCDARLRSGVAHHLAHAACAFFTSPFYDSAVLTVDAQGEDESASLGEFTGSRYRKLQSIWSPHSIGIVYALVTDYLGMRSAWDEYKVMAMASGGDPARFRAVLDRLVRTGCGGVYHTYRTAMVFKPGYCDTLLARELGVPKRASGDPLEQVHFDIAAALQDKTEQVLFHLLGWLRVRTSSPNLCLAGGVFQKSVANGKILASGLLSRIAEFPCCRSSKFPMSPGTPMV